MNRYWWSRWLPSYAPLRNEYPEQEAKDEEGNDTLSMGEAATLLHKLAGARAVDQAHMAQAARRLQRRLGNQGVRRLAADKGDRLPSGLRTEVSGDVGADLNDVRIHTGPTGHAVAHAAGAQAVTVGRDIAFADGAYAPETAAGRQLLAHEASHTVQAGLGSGKDTTTLEREAQTPGHPAPGSAGLGQALLEEVKSWGDRVREAQAETDAKKRRVTFIALVQEALAGYTLFVVPASSSSGPVNPKDYRPVPAINFDLHLENKEYWPGAGRKGKLGPRAGYFFSAAGKAYAIIGPGAIEASTPALTKMHADHELFHATHHVDSDKSFNDRELEAWTNAFIHYFHQVYKARGQWKPLIDYYEGATKSARKTALTALVSYYGQQSEEVQKAMLVWLKRRQGDMADKLLVKHLAGRLVPPTPAAPAPAPTPPPPSP